MYVQNVNVCTVQRLEGLPARMLSDWRCLLAAESGVLGKLGLAFLAKHCMRIAFITNHCNCNAICSCAVATNVWLPTVTSRVFEPLAPFTRHRLA